ncbi:hypothetical protein BW723_15415 [Polaribacter reichenbachii]|uniref:Uncharacterized protein n=1 Tax=Polaribacter reichenbachii TaxID=996801 RepID=A0A1B8U5C2_9FLAO|nr:hypothetical protein [Polaribacter reichenbachii]APZ47588.1 hypothetical protein BW723_15415 [Polaribacter reichenbachii]AUC18228.1 hypothetical protein BTO17_05860 [Polaribacter reichenbachii]OBY67059.1 hypothetical protein LPB301_04375 [Polaribacter reichenbachii]
MKTNKIDKDIKQKFENRTFKPSASAWERLSVQLDEQPKQKKIGWFFYIGAAASILLLVTIGIKMFTNDTEEIIPKDQIVISPIDTNLIDKKIEKFINEIPVEEALVKQKEVEIENKKNTEKVIVKKEKYRHKKNNNTKKEQTVIAKVDVENKNIIPTEIEKSPINKTGILEQDPNSTIKINADDLLYAVTHSPREVKEYYAKYNVNREDVLKTIKNELKKSNLKVNPNTILAEVERTIDDDAFQNNFMKSLKRRVTDIASAIASRND